MAFIPLFPAALVFGLGFVFALINWVAVIRQDRRLEYVFKPATLVAFIVGAWLLAGQTGGGRLAHWFVPALGFSLLGDVFLMLPGERWFPLGLGAFLVAHICYVVGLTPSFPPVASLVLLVLIAVADLIVLPAIVRGVADHGAQQLRVPVVIYAIVLSLALFAGWATWFRSDWQAGARALVSVGTALFFGSDLMLAWNKFVRESRVLHILVIVTYHLAQLALALAVGLHPG